MQTQYIVSAYFVPEFSEYSDDYRYICDKTGRLFLNSRYAFI